MITEIKIDRWKYISIETDDWCLHDYPLVIKSQFSERKFNYKKRKTEIVTYEIETPYYEWETETGFAFRYTQLPILLHHYAILGLLPNELYSKYIQEFLLTEISVDNLPKSLGSITLRDEQLDVLKVLMTKRFGLCHIYTGFGKTEMIAYMCKFYRDVMNWRVLISTSNAKVLDEIVYRVNSRLGINIGVNYPNDSGILAFNAASLVKQSYNHHNFKDYLEGIDVILSDEVETCLTRTHHEVYDYCINRKCMYGFSATPDCYCGRLDITNVIDKVHFRNKHLLDTFGGSLVNIVAKGFEINVIEVKVPWLTVNSDELKSQIDEYFNKGDIKVFSSNYRNELDNDLFMRSEFARLLGELSIRYPNLVVTINRTEIIDYWVSQLPELKIFEVSGRGYRFHYMYETTNVSQDYLKNNYESANLILGSKSLIRGIDLPNLCSSIQLSGRKSGTTIQSIGRTSRNKLMNVILILPKDSIPGYSNQNKERIELIKTQYPEEFNKINYITMYSPKPSVRQTGNPLR
jgi:hypothetical protein